MVEMTIDKKYKITRAYFKGVWVQTPPPLKDSDFFLKREGKEVERK